MFHVWAILWKPFMQPSVLTCWSCTTFMKFVKSLKGVSILYTFGGYISNCFSLNLNPWCWTPKIWNLATQEWKDKHEPKDSNYVLGWQKTQTKSWKLWCYIQLEQVYFFNIRKLKNQRFKELLEPSNATMTTFAHEHKSNFRCNKTQTINWCRQYCL
jgi:hypothetical protein